MSNPNNALWVLIGLICLWPLITFGLGVLSAIAIQRGWLRSPIDPTKAPKLNWKRNDR